MTPNLGTVLAEQSAQDNLERIRTIGHKHHGYPIVATENEQTLLGIITHHEMEELSAAGDHQPISQWVEGQQTIRIHPDDSIRDAANTLVIKDVLQAPIVSRKDNTKLLGMVTLHDIARQQNAIEDALD